MTVHQYATPLAFKQALEQRLRSSSATGTDFARRRQLLVFDRFLARLNQVAGDTVTLKGGLVLELRLARARTTKDVDLRMTGSSEDVLERLQEAGRLDLGDAQRPVSSGFPRVPRFRAIEWRIADPMADRGGPRVAAEAPGNGMVINWLLLGAPVGRLEYNPP